MTLVDDVGRADLGLVTDVRDGRSEAFAELYRRHREPALRYALAMTQGDHAAAQDIVSEAFARVLAVMSRGGGSEFAFRPYLMAAVRNEYLAELKRYGRVDLVEHADDLEPPDSLDRGLEGGGSEDSNVYAAFRRLPPRWQAVLWHTEIEGERPATVAGTLDMTPNAVSALASRARERLRQEYLQEQVARFRPGCRPYADQLARLVRGRLRRRERQRLERHLHGCAECHQVRNELTDLNSKMRAFLLPALLGPGGAWSFLSAPGLLAAGPPASAAAAASGAVGCAVAGSSATATSGVMAGAAATSGVAAGVAGGVSLAQAGVAAAVATASTAMVMGMSLADQSQEGEAVATVVHTESAPAHLLATTTASSPAATFLASTAPTPSPTPSRTAVDMTASPVTTAALVTEPAVALVDSPTPTPPSPQPTAAEIGVAETARPSSPSPTQTSSPSPTETSSPSPTETSSPSPTETSSPSPTQTSSESDGASSTPESSSNDAAEGDKTGEPTRPSPKPPGRGEDGERPPVQKDVRTGRPDVPPSSRPMARDDEVEKAGHARAPGLRRDMSPPKRSGLPPVRPWGNQLLDREQLLDRKQLLDHKQPPEHAGGPVRGHGRSGMSHRK